MRHSNAGKKFSRTVSHRRALLRNLAKALLSHGRIRTTEIKAKALRGVVEPLITLALRNDLHARRLAYRVLGSHSLVKRLFDEIGPAFVGVPGGYTRVVKLAKPRRGDNAPLAVIELTRGGPGGAEASPPNAAKKRSKAAKAQGAPSGSAPDAAGAVVDVTPSAGSGEAAAEDGKHPHDAREQAGSGPEAG
jgi:large subunit ribosomal protein L17